MQFFSNSNKLGGFTFKKAKNKPPSREGACLIYWQGKILLVGGLFMTDRLDIRMFDSGSSLWSKFEISSFIPAMQFCQLCPSKKGVFIAGGEIIKERRLNPNVYFIDLFSGSVKTFKPQRFGAYFPRKHFTMHCVGNELLIFGGINSEITADCVIFDSKIEKWRDVKYGEPVFRANSASIMAFTRENRVLAQHGEYNFNNIPKLSKGRNMLKEGIYLFGGLDEKNLPRNELFFIKIGKEKISMKEAKFKGKRPKSRSDCSLCFSEDLEIGILHGGQDGSQGRVFNDTFILDFKKQEFVQIVVVGVRPKLRFSHNSAVLDGKVYIFGGMDDSTFIGTDFYIIDLDQENAKGIESEFGEKRRYDLHLTRKAAEQVKKNRLTMMNLVKSVEKRRDSVREGRNSTMLSLTRSLFGSIE